MRLGAPILCCLLASCGHWHRQPLGEVELIRRDEVVEVWTGRKHVRLKAIRLGPDSVTGVLFFKPTDCDSCRIAIPRAAVDSVRRGGSTFEGPLAWLVVAMGVAFVSLLIAFSGWEQG